MVQAKYITQETIIEKSLGGGGGREASGNPDVKIHFVKNWGTGLINRAIYQNAKCICTRVD